MLSSSAEDYLEAIYLLEQSKKAVRVKDISRELDVSMPSVHQALHNLKEKKLIQHEHYGYVELTRKGRDTGRRINHRHNIIFKFFQSILNVPEEIAETEACRVEHYISDRTLEKLENFIEKVGSCPYSDFNCDRG